MTEIDAAMVGRKLAVVVRNLGVLAEIESLTLELYRTDVFRRKATERLLQELVEAAVDVNVHILRSTGGQAPQDYHQSFVSLGQQGVIPRKLADDMAPAAGLRNRLVHEYDEIDDAIVHAAVGLARRQFAEYVAAIERYLASQGR